MKTKVLLCTCGGVLEDSLDYKALEDYAAGLEGVSSVSLVESLCTPASQALLEELLKGHDHVLSLACTRSVCGANLEYVAQRMGIPVEHLALVNAREQVAYVHSDPVEATAKAKRLMKVAQARLTWAREQEEETYSRVQEVLVVGGGVAGLTAASELADQGFKVHVVERSPSIGGAMPLISKTYPEEDCSKCLRGPRMLQLLTKPGITFHLSSEVTRVERTPTGFKVWYEKKPVKLDSKGGVGTPVEAVRTGPGLYTLVYSVEPSPESLELLSKSKCGSCTSLFPSALLEFWEEPGEKELEVGAVVLATGFQDFDPSGIPKWGYGLDNVVTQFQLARMMDPYGPTGGRLVKPSDAQTPEKIVMIQCVGSRDPAYLPDCSKYCCMAAIKHATLIKKYRAPEAQVTILFRDIRANGYRFEALYNEAKALGVEFVHGDVSTVTQEGGGLKVSYLDGLEREKELEADLVVLSTGMAPSEGAEEVARLFNVDLAPSGFYKAVDEKVANTTTKSPGVFIAGTASGPKNIPDSIAQAGAAAHLCGNYLRTHITKKSNTPTVNEENCGRCGICRSVCPYGAITLPPEEPPVFDPLLCQSCGLCVSSCPTRALDSPNFGYDLIDAQVEAALSEKGRDPAIIGFICDDCGYNLLDTAGFTKTEYTPWFTPIYVNCLSSLSLRNVLNSIKLGADAVLLVGCVRDRCHFLKGTDRSRGQMEVIKRFAESSAMPTPIMILESSGTMVSQFKEALDSLVKRIEGGL